MAQSAYIVAAAEDLVHDGRKAPQFDSKIYHPAPNQAPFTAITTKMGTEGVDAIKHIVFSEFPMSRTGTVTTASNSGSTTIIVDSTSADWIVEGDILQFKKVDGTPLDFQVHVTGNSSGTLTVVRPWGGTDAAIPAGALMEFIYNSRSERDTKSPVRMLTSEETTQYLVQIEGGIDISYLQGKTAYRGKPENLRLRAQQLRRFEQQREAGALFGYEKVDTTVSGQSRWSTKGIRQYAKDWNEFIVGGKLDLDSFVDAIQQVDTYGSDGGPLTVYCSQLILAQVAKWGFLHDIERSKHGSKRLNFDISKIKVPRISADVTFIPHPMFEARNECLIADMMAVKQVQLGGRGMFTEDDVQTPGDWTKETHFKEVFGMKVIQPSRLGLLTQITGVK